MPIADSTGAKTEMLPNVGHTAEPLNEVACIVHRLEEYTPREQRASGKRESPFEAEVHRLPFAKKTLFQKGKMAAVRKQRRAATVKSAPLQEDSRSARIIEMGYRIRVVIKLADLDQGEVAKRIGVTDAAISNWVNASGSSSELRTPNLWAMIDLCEQFGVDLDYIYRGKMDGMTISVVNQLREAEKKLK